MKKRFLLFIAVVIIAMTTYAQKIVYIPDSWQYNATTEEYTENGNSELQW